MVIRNRELLERDAPAVFAEMPESGRVSDKYSFLPTTDVLSILGDEGWEPWKATQVKSRTWSKQHAKHLVRLRNEKFGVGSLGDESSFPEMVLTNSHNGISSYELMGGLFRMICSNGIIVSEEDFGHIHLRHIGFEAQDVVDASRKFTEQIDGISTRVKEWKGFGGLMNWEELASEYFTGAAKLRFEDPSEHLIGAVSQPRRKEDAWPNLWAMFNIAQENLLKGGYMNVHTRRKVKPITSIQTDIELNSSLWEYTNNFFRERSYGS